MEFGQELDVLVIGAYFGEGRRGGIHSSFLCGLRVDDNPPTMKFVPYVLSDVDFFRFAKLEAGFPQMITLQSGLISGDDTDADIKRMGSGLIGVRGILLQRSSWNSKGIMKNPINGSDRMSMFFRGSAN